MLIYKCSGPSSLNCSFKQSLIYYFLVLCLRVRIEGHIYRSTGKTHIISLKHTHSLSTVALSFLHTLSSLYLSLHHSPTDWSARGCHWCKQRAFGPGTNPINIQRQSLFLPARYCIILPGFLIHPSLIALQVATVNYNVWVRDVLHFMNDQ